MKVNSFKKEHDLIRKKLWCDIAISYINAANTTEPSRAVKWADHVLKEFDERFRSFYQFKNT